MGILDSLEKAKNKLVNQAQANYKQAQTNYKSNTGKDLTLGNVTKQFGSSVTGFLTAGNVGSKNVPTYRMADTALTAGRTLGKAAEGIGWEKTGQLARDTGSLISGAARLTPGEIAGHIGIGSSNSRIKGTERERKLQDVGQTAYGLALTAPLTGATSIKGMALAQAKNAARGAGLGASIGVAGQALGTLGGHKTSLNSMVEAAKKGAASGLKNSYVLPITGAIGDKILGASKFTSGLTGDALKAAAGKTSQLAKAGQYGAAFKNALGVIGRNTAAQVLTSPIETAAFTLDDKQRLNTNKGFISRYKERFVDDAAGNALNGVMMSSIGQVGRLGEGAYKFEKQAAKFLQDVPKTDRKQAKTFYKNALGVKEGIDTQAMVGNLKKLKQVVGLPSDTPDVVMLRAEALDHLLAKHPDEFNRALAFIKTINFPDRVIDATDNQKPRIHLFKQLDDQYEMMNKTVLKPLADKNVTVVNTSYSTSTPKIMRKWERNSQEIVDSSPGGAGRPTSPIGEGSRLFPSSGEADGVDLSSGGTPAPTSPEGAGQRNLPTSEDINNVNVNRDILPQPGKNVKGQNVNKLEDGDDVLARIMAESNNSEIVDNSGGAITSTSPKGIEQSFSTTELIDNGNILPQPGKNVKGQNVNKLEDEKDVLTQIMTKSQNEEEPQLIKIADKSESLSALKQAYKQYGAEFYDHLNENQKQYYDKLLDEAPKAVDDTYLDPVTGEKVIDHAIYRDTQGRPAVEIDERYLEGKKPEEYRKLIKNKVMEKFAGKSYTIGDTEYSAQVGKNTAGKLSMPSNRQQTTKNYRNKGESAGNLDEIIQSLHNVRVEQNLKTDKQPNIDKYIKGEVEVKIGDKIYYPTMSFRVYEDGSIVAHDVVFGETGPGLTPGWLGAATSVFPRNSRQRGSVKDTDILSQPGENVNSQNVNNEGGLQRTQYQKNLVDALNNGVDKPVNFGYLSQDKINKLNSIRDIKGLAQVKNNQLILSPEVIQHLHDRRIISDQMSADEVADVLYSALHNTSSLVLPTSKPHTQAIAKFNNDGDTANVAYLSDFADEPGNMTPRSAYVKDVETIKKQALEGGSFPSYTGKNQSLVSTKISESQEPVLTSTSDILPQSGENVKGQNVNKLEDGDDVLARIMAESNNEEESQFIKIADKSESLSALKQAYKQYGAEFYDHLNENQKRYYDKLLDEAPKAVDDTYLDPVTGEKVIDHAIYRDTQGRPAVEIDERYLEGKNLEEYKGIIKQKIKEKFQGKSYQIGSGDQSATVTSNTAGKLSSPAYSGQSDIDYRNRGEAAGNLDEIIENLHNVCVEKNMKPDSRTGLKQVIKGEIEVKVGDQILYPTVVIREYENGNVAVHDISNIGRESGGTRSSSSASPLPSNAELTSDKFTNVDVNSDIVPQPGKNVNSQNVNISPNPVDYIQDARGATIAEYNRVPAGWSVVSGSRIAPEGYTAILDNRSDGTGMKGLIKNSSLTISDQEMQATNVPSIKIADPNNARTSEVMDALGGNQVTSQKIDNDEWNSILSQEGENIGPRKSTAASVLDPVETPFGTYDPANEPPAPGPYRGTAEENEANLKFYENNQPKTEKAQKLKELQAGLDPLKFLSDADRAATDEWRSHILSSQVEADRIARDINAALGNPDDETAWKITQYMQHPTKAYAAKIGLENPEQYDEALKTIRNFYNGLYNQMEEINPGRDFGYRRNYVPQIWDNTPEEIQAILARSAGTKTSFMNERQIPDYETGVRLGLHPKYTNPGQLAAEYYVKSQKALANNELVDSMIYRGVITTADHAPDGWRMLSIDTLPTRGKKAYAPEDVARALNNMFGEGSERSGVLGTLETANKVMQNVVLSGGIPGTPLNSFVYGQTIKELTGGNWRVLPALARSFSSEATENFRVKHQDTIELMAQNGINMGTGNYRNEFKNALGGDEIITDTLGETAMNVLDKAFEEPTFNRFMMIKNVEYFETVYDTAIKNGQTPEAATKAASDLTKSWMGLTDNYARNAKAQQAINGVFFAPGYREGMFNFWKNAAQGLINGIKTGDWSDPTNAQMLKFAAGTAITYGIYNAVNYALTGHFMWENKTGKKLSVEIPEENLPGGEAGRSLYMGMLPSVGTMPRNAFEIGVAILKGDTKTIGQKVGSFFSMPLKLGFELASNQDYFGNPIRDTDESAWKQAKQVAGYVAGDYLHPYIGAALDVATGRRNALESALKVAETPFYGSRSSDTANLTKKQYTTYQGIHETNPDAAASYAQQANAANEQKKSLDKVERSGKVGESNSWWNKIWSKEQQPTPAEEPEMRRQLLKERIKVNDHTLSDDDLDFYFLQDTLNLPASSRLEVAKRNQKLYDLYDKLDDNDYLNDSERAHLKNKILQEAGLSQDEMNYYQKVKDASNNDLKLLTIQDDLEAAHLDVATPEGHAQLLDYLAANRRSVGGKMLATDGVIGELQNRGLISKEEAKALKALDWDEEAGNWKQTTTSSSSGSSGSGRRKIKNTNPYSSLANALRNNSKTSNRRTSGRSFTIGAPQIGSISIGTPSLRQTSGVRIGSANIHPESIILASR